MANLPRVRAPLGTASNSMAARKPLPPRARRGRGAPLDLLRARAQRVNIAVQRHPAVRSRALGWRRARVALFDYSFPRMARKRHSKMTPVRFPRRRVVPRSAVSRRAVQQSFPKLVGVSCPEMPRGAAWCRAAPRFAELRGNEICIRGALSPLTEPWPAADTPALRLIYHISQPPEISLRGCSGWIQGRIKCACAR